MCQIMYNYMFIGFPTVIYRDYAGVNITDIIY